MQINPASSGNYGIMPGLSSQPTGAPVVGLGSPSMGTCMLPGRVAGGGQGPAGTSGTVTSMLVAVLGTLVQTVNTLVSLIAGLFGGGQQVAGQDLGKGAESNPLSVSSLLDSQFDPIRRFASMALSGKEAAGGGFGGLIDTVLGFFGGDKAGGIVSKVGSAIKKIF